MLIKPELFAFSQKFQRLFLFWISNFSVSISSKGEREMLQFIFLLSDSGEVMLEKLMTGHRVDRSICDWFWDYVLSQGGDSSMISQVITSPTHYLFQVFREGITFLACTQIEMPPLMGIEFLCRVADFLNDYLGGINEDLMKDNFVIVYEVSSTLLKAV